MRVVVVGATGNVGTSLLAALETEERVESVLGLARRLPRLELPKVEWGRADIAYSDLEPGERVVVPFKHLVRALLHVRARPVRAM